jgi:hypothetical protein
MALEEETRADRRVRERTAAEVDMVIRSVESLGRSGRGECEEGVKIRVDRGWKEKRGDATPSF